MPKILLAEDDFTMVTLLKALLNMEGYQVENLLERKEDPLDAIRIEKPDVLLLDVHLGDRNGVELIRQIRHSPDLKNLRVVMTSGIDKTEECLAAGADDFLLKPFMPEELIQKIRVK